MKLSKDGQLSLSLDEMKTIRGHFRDLQRDPTDIELESLAQTWSEHCSHKTLKGIIECVGVRAEAPATPIVQPCPPGPGETASATIIFLKRRSSAPRRKSASG